MKSAMGLLADSYGELFAAMKKYGYELFFKLITYEDESERRLDVVAQFNGDIIATADFTCDSCEAHCNNVNVHKEHQRRKIATAMYCVAESAFGVTLANHWHSDPIQSIGAQSLWANKNRPFGGRQTDTISQHAGS